MRSRGIVAGGVPIDGAGRSDGDGDDGAEQQLDLRLLARVLSAKMMAMPRDGNMSCTAVLLGCLEVVRDLIEIEGPDGTLLDGTELGQVRVFNRWEGMDLGDGLARALERMILHVLVVAGIS